MSLVTKSLSAASKGDLNTLKSLKLQFNLSECCDKFGASPVHYAARAGKVDCLRWLVQTAGVSGNKSANNGASPAHDAAATGQLDCLQWLIENGGCSATGRDSCGATPLHLAARFGHLNVVVWLVESEGCSALDRAQNGVTPVHLAAAKGSINCLKWLSQNNPNAVNKRADNGTTPVYFAAQEGRLDCLQFLFTQVDGNCRLRASDGMAPVHAAAQMGQLECLAWLVENASVSPNEKDNDGATPAHFAAARGHVHVLRWLLGHGGKVETDDLGGTPLHDAAEHGQLESLKVLLANGINPHIKDLDGMTPADLAKECNHSDCVAFLSSYQPLHLPEIAVDSSFSDVPHSNSSYPTKSAISATSRQKQRHGKIATTNVTTEARMPLNSNRDVGNYNKSSAITPKPANIALMTEKNELKHVFAKLNKHPPASPNIQLEVHHRHMTDNIVLELEPEEESPKANLADVKKQDSALLKEVCLFETDDLKSIPSIKKNLVSTKLGHVKEDNKNQPKLSSDRSQVIKPGKVPGPPAQVTVRNGEESDDDDDDEYARVPLWKKALMKKRDEEQRLKEITKKQQVEAEEAKWTNVPAWKRAVLDKKEAEKNSQKKIIKVQNQKEVEEQARFAALPNWKKQIILNKRQV